MHRDPKLPIGLGEIRRTFEASFRSSPHEAASQGRDHRVNDRAMFFLIRDNEQDAESCNEVFLAAHKNSQVSGFAR